MIEQVKGKVLEYDKIIQPLTKDGISDEFDNDSENKERGEKSKEVRISDRSSNERDSNGYNYTDKLIRNSDRSSNENDSGRSNSTDRVVIEGPRSSTSKTVQFEEDRYVGLLPYGTHSIFGDSFLNYSQMDFTRIRETSQLSSYSDDANISTPESHETTSSGKHMTILRENTKVLY